MAEARRELQQVEESITVTSNAFGNGDAIPPAFTCEGADTSIPLTFNGIPDDARAIAVVMDDPDAPKGTFTHWTAWNIPPKRTDVPKGADLQALGAKEGQNGFGRSGYGGPCPPQGEEHRYFLKVYALNDTLDLPNGASVDAVYDALEGKVIARGELMGTFKKS